MKQRLLKMVTLFLSGDADSADYLVGGGVVNTRKHHYSGHYVNGYFIITDEMEDVFKVKV